MRLLKQLLPWATVALSLARPATAVPLVPPSLPPTEVPGLQWSGEFFPGVRYRTEVPALRDLLGTGPGERAATTEEIQQCLQAWAAAVPDRARLDEYARSHGNRPLQLMVVASPANLARLEEIQRGVARLADPRGLDPAEARRLIDTLPAIAWLGYSIHGDETEGADAALVLIHHLLAAEDGEVERILADVVVVVDPLMNPDGRSRFLKMLAEGRGTTPSVDDQALVHDGYWPYGRGNHYLLDLNRDYLWLTQPETRGRARAIARWNPQLLVDAHGMGPQDTHLFSPPREPSNPNIPPASRRWEQVFAADQAAAFDRHGLVYYTGEWNEDWYPGYTNSWAAYRGAIGILYEQARIAVDGVRRPEGRILSYRESVFHHVVGTMANLSTLARHARDVRNSFHETRRAACDPAGPYGQRTFAVLPAPNRGRLEDFLRLLELQGIEAFASAGETIVPKAVDQLGREHDNLTLPAGTILIPNRQPLAHLVAALLEFDPRLSEPVLVEERQEILRRGESRIYDVTAWNATMLWGLEALTLPSDLPPGARPLDLAAVTMVPPATSPSAGAVAHVIDGADDRSVAAAARLMERGVRVRVAEKPFEFGGAAFARASVVITALDNRSLGEALEGVVDKTASELRLAAVPVLTGLGVGELPDLGGSHFRLLEPPRIGVFGRQVSTTGFGSVWHTLDHRLGIRSTNLDASPWNDLARYNVLIVPEHGYSRADDSMDRALKDWVRSGGTLIAIGDAAARFAAEKSEFSKVRLLPDVLGKLADYELAVLREWQGRLGTLPSPNAIWAHRPAPELTFPWTAIGGPHPDEKELKRRDDWQTLFMPQGALLATRVDNKHWLTAGCIEPLPVLATQQPLLMAADGVEAPIRYGYLLPNPAAAGPPAADTAAAPSKQPGKGEDKGEPPRIGWSALPEETEMHLRMSGLLWPEAAHRVANTAWVTRESFGRGQIILFAVSPTLRVAARGTERVFLNAVVFGPGLGASHPILPRADGR